MLTKTIGWKKIITLSLCLCFWGKSVFAQENLYLLIMEEVSAYNTNAQEADWITRAILYSSDLCAADPLLVTAVMKVESRFRIDAVSPAGAIGPMQLMPETAAILGVNPYNPLDNIIGGTRYLSEQRARFAGWGTYAITIAVAAYNAGPGAIYKYDGVPPYRETRDYVRGVAAEYHKLAAQR